MVGSYPTETMILEVSYIQKPEALDSCTLWALDSQPQCLDSHPGGLCHRADVRQETAEVFRIAFEGLLLSWTKCTIKLRYLYKP